MKQELLLRHFDRISDTPDAIPRLRQFILDLAVRGKLVEQNPTDEPVAAFLNRIDEGKGHCGKRSDTRDANDLPQVGNAPYAIPTNWRWVTFGRVVVSRDSERVPVSREERSSRPKIFDYYGASGIIDKIDAFLFDKPLLLIGEDGANLINRSTPIAFIARGQYWVNNHAHVLDGISEAFLRFLALYINAIDLKPYVTGTAQPKMNQAKMNSIPIALPPESEQRNIVSKVDELMSLCDQLEAAQGERETRCNRMSAASLNHLTTDANPGAFREHARFFINQLSKLTAQPEHIKQIRQTILSLAMRGQLVPQDPKDEPASNLLQRIQGERTSLVKDGRIRQEKPLSPIDPRQVPFAVPDSWLWARIGQAALFTEYGTSHQSAHTEKGVPTLKMGDIQDGRVVLGGQKKVPTSIDDLPALYLEKYDLLYNRTNSAELVGKTGIFLGEDNDYTFASYLIRIRCSKTASDARFVNLAMNAPYFRTTQIVPHLKQQCGQANVNGTTLKSMAIPFPPLAEQRRIVARVDELMAICDRLETQLASVRAGNRRLLDAVLHEALNSTMPVVEAA